MASDWRRLVARRGRGGLPWPWRLHAAAVASLLSAAVPSAAAAAAAASSSAFSTVQRRQQNGGQAAAQPLIKVQEDSDPADVSKRLKGMIKAVHQEEKNLKSKEKVDKALSVEAQKEAKKAKNLTEEAFRVRVQAIDSKNNETKRELKKKADRLKQQAKEHKVEAKKNIQKIKTDMKEERERPCSKYVEPPERPEPAPAPLAPPPACPVEKGDKNHIMVAGNSYPRKFGAKAEWITKNAAIHNQQEFIVFRIKADLKTCMVRCVAVACCIGISRYTTEGSKSCWGFSGGQLRTGQANTASYLIKGRLKGAKHMIHRRVHWKRKKNTGWSKTTHLFFWMTSSLKKCLIKCVDELSCIGVTREGRKCTGWKDGSPQSNQKNQTAYIVKSAFKETIQLPEDAIVKERSKLQKVR